MVGILRSISVLLIFSVELVGAVNLRISPEPDEVAPGETIVFNLELAVPSEPVSGFQAILELPSNIIVDTVQIGSGAHGFEFDHSVADAAGAVRINLIGYNFGGTASEGALLATIHARVEETAQPGQENALMLAGSDQAGLPWTYPSAAADGEPQVVNAISSTITITVSFTDDDQNGLDDAWEFDNFGQTGIDPGIDHDGDGQDALFEYHAGTDPNDSKSFIALEILENGPQIEVFAYPPGNFLLQENNTPLDPEGWLNLDLEPSEFSSENPAVIRTGHQQAFFRLIAPASPQ